MSKFDSNNNDGDKVESCEMEPILQRSEPWIARRHLVVFFASTAGGLLMLLRYNLSMAIVQMTKQDINLTVKYGTPHPEWVAMQDIRLDWDATMQGNVLGSYFITYMIFNPIGGILAERYGGRWVMFLGTFVPALLTFISPIVVINSTAGFIVVRMLIGAFNGLIHAAGFSLIARWCPPREQTFGLACIQAGSYVGSLLAMLITGYICDSPALGWPGAFYIAGCLPILWAIPYLYYVYDSPEVSPRVSHKELIYLTNEGVIKDSNATSLPPKPHIPWMGLLTSGAIWGTVAAKFCRGFGNYVQSEKLPAYMDEVFGVPIDLNGVYNALPFAAYAVFCFGSAKLAEILVNSGRLSLLTTRRLFSIVSMAGPTLCVILVPLIGTSHVIVEVLIVMSQVTGAFCAGGDAPNIADYAGRHFTGLVFGVTNTMTGLDGLLSPIIVGAMLEAFPGAHLLAWNYVFYLTGVVFLTGNVIFLLLVKADLEPWAVVD